MNSIVNRYQGWADTDRMRTLSSASVYLVAFGMLLTLFSTAFAWAAIALAVIGASYAAFAPEVIRWQQKRQIARSLRGKTMVEIGTGASFWEKRLTVVGIAEVVTTNTFWTMFQPRDEVRAWAGKNLEGDFGFVPMNFLDLVEEERIQAWFSSARDAERFRARWLSLESQA